jgi:hypothetical protein
MYKLTKISNTSKEKKKARDSFSYLDGGDGKLSKREHEILQENNSTKGNHCIKRESLIA